MSDLAIRVENVSKLYRIGLQSGGGFQYKTLRDVLTETVTSPFRRLRRTGDRGRKSEPPLSAPAPRSSVSGPSSSGPQSSVSGQPSSDGYIWALKDVSFEVKPGEVIGIIGRNGAGKTTLLKLLSRIIKPTEGHAEIYGRVGSLLEVGTGFHPELTGRENIYLNGAILGMKKAEISRKFDQIVAFAEVEKFIDTPVKHYSSGMYVRLAFAVAAHLEPEILLIDEVLAVGDAAFQKKCLGKIGEVAREDRTVLFVSHNMGAVASLCPRAILLRDGRVADRGDSQTVVGSYLESFELQARSCLRDRTDREGTGRVRLTSFRILNAECVPIEHVMSGQACTLELSYESDGQEPLRNVFFQVMVSSLFGQALFVCLTRSSGGNFPEAPPAGRATCAIPGMPLSPGTYLLTLTCKVNEVIADHVPGAYRLSVISGDFFGSGRLPPPSSGPLLVQHSWRLEGPAIPVDLAAGRVSA